MQVGILKTDHGPHSAEALAAATAGEIIEIGAGAAGETAVAGRRLELQILDILEAHHDVVATAEKDNLKADTERLNHPHDCHDVVDEAVTEILAAGASSAWAEHFADPGVAEQIHKVVGKWLATNQHVHRGWHAHENPDHPAVAEFHGRWNNGPKA